MDINELILEIVKYIERTFMYPLEYIEEEYVILDYSF